MAYVEILLSEYAFLDLPSVMGGKHAARPLRLAAGLQLLEARACRLAPDHSIGFVERSIMHARAAVRAWYAERFDIVPTPPRVRAPEAAS